VKRYAATPGRHGAPLTLPLVGPVVGFAVALAGAIRPGLWMTGDTVLYGALRRYAADLAPEVALVHMGAVRFGLSGPLRYTMNAKEGAELIAMARPDVVVPIHVEGWSHFSEQEEAARRVFATARVPGVRSGPCVRRREWPAPAVHRAGGAPRRGCPEVTHSAADRLGGDFRGAPSDDRYDRARRAPRR